jgi:hypothetical protein
MQMERSEGFGHGKSTNPFVKLTKDKLPANPLYTDLAAAHNVAMAALCLMCLNKIK